MTTKSAGKQKTKLTPKQEIVIKQIVDLVPYLKNARVHDDAQVNLIADSIREFGFNNPILLDGKNGVIAGHGRLMAARKLKMTEVPCIELAHLSDTQRRAYILADNQLATKSGWDAILLREEINSLVDENFDISMIGFNDAELSQYIGNTTSEDPEALWKGMPEYNQEDKMAHRTLFVHFRNDEDFAAFMKLTQQEATEKTKYIWYPEKKNDVLKDKAYIAK